VTTEPRNNCQVERQLLDEIAQLRKERDDLLEAATRAGNAYADSACLGGYARMAKAMTLLWEQINKATKTE